MSHVNRGIYLHEKLFWALREEIFWGLLAGTIFVGRKTGHGWAASVAAGVAAGGLLEGGLFFDRAPARIMAVIPAGVLYLTRE